MRFDIDNVGDVAGRETAQVYVRAPQTGLDKPELELKGFAKTATLAPGETESMTVALDITSLTSFDAAQRVGRRGRRIAGTAAARAVVRQAKLGGIA